MTYRFKATLYQTGINWAVDVPVTITQRLEKEKGYIRVKGQINGFDFKQTLVPVKDAPYRLFVNGPMMKGAATAVGKTARFSITQNTVDKRVEYPPVPLLQKRLKEEKLTTDFHALSASRIKDILKYLSYIKTEQTLIKNIEKVINQLRNKEKHPRIP